jgi:hypothetical protein
MNQLGTKCLRSPQVTDTIGAKQNRLRSACNRRK